MPSWYSCEDHELTVLCSAEIGAHPQTGKLVGATQHEVVVEVDHGVRLHFPRIGYIVRKR